MGTSSASLASTGAAGGRGAGFVRADLGRLGVGYLMALGSSVGQTFFISLFAQRWMTEFGLSQGQFGLIYMTATLASAAVLIQFGRLVDSAPAHRLAPLVALGLGAVAGLTALTPGWWALIPLIFGLRLFGQGMMTHVSRTLTARWFVASRGKALALTALGHPTGEALAPLLFIALLAAFGWRVSWGVAALFAVCLAPVLWLLLSRDRRRVENSRAEEQPVEAAACVEGAAPSDREETDVSAGLGGRHWSRGEAARGALFWLLAPSVIAPSFMLTIFFFLPAHIESAKGWAPDSLPALYWIYALSAVVGGLICGPLIDRFSARLGLPIYQAPMAIGLGLLAFSESPAAAPVFLMLFGLTAGAAASLLSALWAELYGTRHLGSIKALAAALLVFGSAIGPGFAGLLIDLGVDFPTQAGGMALYVLAASAVSAVLLAQGRLGAVERGQ